MRFINPYNEFSAALAPNDYDYPYNSLTPKERKNSEQLIKGRTDSFNDLMGKKVVAPSSNVNNKSES